MLIATLSVAGRADELDSKVWQPFESEMDWQVGSWAVNEEVHQGAIDRLLSIPGVRILVLCSVITAD